MTSAISMFSRHNVACNAVVVFFFVEHHILTEAAALCCVQALLAYCPVQELARGGQGVVLECLAAHRDQGGKCPHLFLDSCTPMVELPHMISRAVLCLATVHAESLCMPCKLPTALRVCARPEPGWAGPCSCRATTGIVLHVQVSGFLLSFLVLVFNYLWFAAAGHQRSVGVASGGGGGDALHGGTPQDPRRLRMADHSGGAPAAPDDDLRRGGVPPCSEQVSPVFQQHSPSPARQVPHQSRLPPHFIHACCGHISQYLPQ